MSKYEPAPSLPWASRIILRTEVGSTAHGTGLPDMEDYDEIGVMWEPEQKLFGIDLYEPQLGLPSTDHPDDPVEFKWVPKWPDTITYRPERQEGERSQPGDYDLVVHTARKFCDLAAKGNPSILMGLFGPLRFSTTLGDEMRELAPAFWSDLARERFLGYSRAQRERMLGLRGGAHTNRPELVSKYGYDTKYAMHMLRLGIQGMEYAQTGKITLPIPAEQGDFLRAVRRGEYSLDEVIARADTNEAALEMMEGSAPEKPDYDLINEWLREVAMSTTLANYASEM